MFPSFHAMEIVSLVYFISITHIYKTYYYKSFQNCSILLQHKWNTWKYCYSQWQRLTCFQKHLLISIQDILFLPTINNPYNNTCLVSQAHITLQTLSTVISDYLFGIRRVSEISSRYKLSVYRVRKKPTVKVGSQGWPVPARLYWDTEAGYSPGHCKSRSPTPRTQPRWTQCTLGRKLGGTRNVGIGLDAHILPRRRAQKWCWLRAYWYHWRARSCWHGELDK